MEAIASRLKLPLVRQSLLSKMGISEPALDFRRRVMASDSHIRGGCPSGRTVKPCTWCRKRAFMSDLFDL